MSTLVSFKAGKLQDKEGAAGKFTITPDKRKGQVTVLKDAMDQLMRFQWQDRVTRAVVDDIIVMPGDMEFTKVDTGRPQDRVYLLQMKNSTRRFFYWMQDKSADKVRTWRECDILQKYVVVGQGVPAADEQHPEVLLLDAGQER
eukprot:TRINITY_DN1750_c0_g2_i1.p1 TRINITY_DN1750_c0_g2~~TRINITY_DN1750_c0_g2_i1.p1  ORF type:complete len:144 (-),score=37.83 TRINITY_DN1750_c0_g2_i1:1412-1843(-)